MELTKSEIKNIIENVVKKELLWEYYDNFTKYQEENDEDMWEFHGLTKKNTGLPVNIFVDDGSSYKMRNHPLWVYFQNDYDDSWAYKEFLPISVGNNPQLLTNKKVKILFSDLQKVVKFIIINKTILKKLSDMKLSQKDFWWKMDINRLNLEESFNDSKKLLNEMATIQPQDSGVPTIIWADEGRKPKHYQGRMKFQAVKGSTNTNTFATITISNNPQILNLPRNYPKDAIIDGKGMEILKNFVKYNEEGLLKLVNGEIKYKTEFFPNMIRMDKNGSPIYPNQQRDPILDFKPVRKTQFGLTMVRANTTGLYNFVNNKRELISQNWFNSAEDFKKYENGVISAIIEIDDKKYWLYPNGNIEEVKNNRNKK